MDLEGFEPPHNRSGTERSDLPELQIPLGCISIDNADEKYEGDGIATTNQGKSDSYTIVGDTYI